MTRTGYIIPSGVVLALFFLVFALPASAASGDFPIDERIIGPGLPPPSWDSVKDFTRMASLAPFALNPTDVPALDWSYGCAATSAAMYFGYLDRNGYPAIYTGETESGVFPLTNEAWGYGECPLSASHGGIDNRTTKGHADDYFYMADSAIDPYYGSWAEHAPPDCLADFMGTSQYVRWQNIDGSTTFFFYTDGAPLDDYSGHEPDSRDGTHGMKLFAESRGYPVTSNYNQYIYGYNGNTIGFTFDQYKAEIDAGNPVFIHVEGHTMLGVGYAGSSEIILHDTWDRSPHTMTFGESYYGMKHFGVSVLHPAPAAGFTAAPVSGPVPLTVSFTDLSGGNLAGWSWDFGDGDPANATVQNPVHTYAVPGNYTVSLTVTGPYGSDTRVMTGLITVRDAIVSLPGISRPPTDPDGDGTWEDLNGNGRVDFADVVLFFHQMEWIAKNEPVAAFDLNGNGRIDFADIVALFEEI